MRRIIRIRQSLRGDRVNFIVTQPISPAPSPPLFLTTILHHKLPPPSSPKAISDECSLGYLTIRAT